MILRSVAPKGRRVRGVRGLEEVTGDMGGAAAALWDSCQESNMQPYRGKEGGETQSKS